MSDPCTRNDIGSVSGIVEECWGNTNLTWLQLTSWRVKRIIIVSLSRVSFTSHRKLIPLLNLTSSKESNADKLNCNTSFVTICSYPPKYHPSSCSCLYIFPPFLASFSPSPPNRAHPNIPNSLTTSDWMAPSVVPLTRTSQLSIGFGGCLCYCPRITNRHFGYVNESS